MWFYECDICALPYQHDEAAIERAALFARSICSDCVGTIDSLLSAAWHEPEPAPRMPHPMRLVVAQIKQHRDFEHLSSEKRECVEQFDAYTKSREDARQRMSVRSIWSTLYSTVKAK